jgi:hypothetical protein
MPEPLMIDGLALEREADEIIAMLIEVLPSHVALIDLDEKQSHARMPRWWFSHEVATADLAATALNRTHHHGSLYVRISRRWILRVVRSGTRVVEDGWIVSWRKALPLSMEDEALVEKAAQLLARFLPATSRFSEVPPPDGTGSGGSGSAELGIPVWWARKARS